MKYELNNNHIIKITQDHFAESPNTNGNTDIFLVYEHSSLQVTRKGFPPKYIYDYLDEKTGTILDHDLDLSKLDNFYIFTVYAYIHSGVRLMLDNPHSNFDVSSTGYVIVNKKELDFDLQRQSNEKCKDLTDEEIAKYYAEGLIETWNTYLSGEVYGYTLFEKLEYKKVYKEKSVIDDNPYFELEEIDSCSGFYGKNINTNGMLDNIDIELTKGIKF